ncbi:hypothetical protein BGZ76_010090 [Entomortierella beljakovae]|nr:hypothetical protein BGZ76_010090 [Entomortierella beljakovae]
MATETHTSSTTKSLLTYPKQQKESTAHGKSTSSKSQTLEEKRIYVGNLDPTIDEYTILELFKPFGKITKLDFMFHWSGPKKGTPRGYCFLEFGEAPQAAAAVQQMNRKTIKNRPLNVSFVTMQAAAVSDSDKSRKRLMDLNRPTAFSLLKSGTLKNASTDEKIKAMERKLAQMSESPKVPATPIHSSLPHKPANTTSSASKNNSSRENNGARSNRGAGASSSTLNRQRPY